MRKLQESVIPASKPLNLLLGVLPPNVTIVSYSSKKLRDIITTAGFKLHLCSGSPCPLAAANLVNALHVNKYATVPQEIELEVKDLSQLDPFFHFLNMCTCCFGSVLYWFCRKSTYGCCAAFRCCSLHFCHSKRQVNPDDSPSDVEEGDQ